jgi:tRNA threonylcarbamoyladenosine biosynthesis protein TsaE
MSISDRHIISVETEGPDQTFAIGRALGEHLFAGSLVCLVGDLGAGKTLMTQGIAAGLQVPADCHVASPTFVFLNIHNGRLPLYHFDAYRALSADAFVDLGVDEYLTGDGVCVIEWADKVEDALPAERLEVQLHHLAPNRRRIELFATPQYEPLIASLA